MKHFKQQSLQNITDTYGTCIATTEFKRNQYLTIFISVPPLWKENRAKSHILFFFSLEITPIIKLLVTLPTGFHSLTT